MSRYLIIIGKDYIISFLMPRTREAIQSGERTLDAFSFSASMPDGRGVLLSHGFRANQRILKNYANPLTKQGITCLSVDLGGHGGSEGELDDLSVEDHLSDLLAAYDRLAAHPDVNPDRIGGVGMSYSGYLSALASSERGFKTLLLRAPPLLPDEFRHTPHGEYSGEEVLKRKPEPDNEALLKLGSFGGVVFLVKMEHDTVVLPPVTDAYEAAIQNGKTVTIEGAGHSLSSDTQPAFRAIADEWATHL